jgi:hypothetical protein
MGDNTKGHLDSNLEFKTFNSSEQLISEFSKWNRLRVVGGSSLGKAAIAFPVIGYLILFNEQVNSYLTLHTNFCVDCRISPRLYSLYIGGFLIAIGSVLYAIFCPDIVERHANAHDFYEGEKDYYDTHEHRLFLINHIIKRVTKSYIAPQYMYPRRPVEELMHNTDLSELMGQHYFLQNRTMRWLRITVLWSYILGFVFLAIPSIWTFVQVMRRGFFTSFGM